MAEPKQGPILLRSKQGIADVVRPGLTLRVEQDLGIGSFRIVGPDAAQAFERLTGHKPPEAGRLETRDEVTYAWLAPAEWLLSGEGSRVDRVIVRINEHGGGSVLAVDLSHGRTAMLLCGEDVRNAIAAHCPLDLSEHAFPISAVARSLLGDAGMFVARLPDAYDGARFRVIVDQTMGPYAARLLAPGHIC